MVPENQRSMPMPKFPPNNIRKLREQWGWSQGELAAKIGINSAQHMGQIENSERRLTAELAQRLADVFKCSVEEVITPVVTPSYAKEKESFIANAIATQAKVPIGIDWDKDLPIMGVAECGAGGEFIMDSTPIDFARRPPSLAKNVKAYALYVVGDSMAPMYPPGELVFVDPARPARVGDPVVVQFQERENSEIIALIKILARRSASKVELQQLNPNKIIALDGRKVIAIHRILRNADFGGI